MILRLCVYISYMCTCSAQIECKYYDEAAVAGEEKRSIDFTVQTVDMCSISVADDLTVAKRKRTTKQ